MPRLTAALASLIAICLAMAGPVPDSTQASGQDIPPPAQSGDVITMEVVRLGGNIRRDGSLPGRPVCFLELRKTEVNDAYLRVIGGLSQLRYLDVGETSITDAGLKELRDLKELKLLHLGETRVTPAAVKELQEALPDTFIFGPEAVKK